MMRLYREKKFVSKGAHNISQKKYNYHKSASFMQTIFTKYIKYDQEVWLQRKVNKENVP